MNQLRVSSLSGDAFAVECRGHTVVVDQPLAGGIDNGLTPVELFVSSLPACVAFYGRRLLARHGLRDTLTVDAKWSMADNPARVSSVEVTVRTEPMPSETQDKFRKVIERCTVHNSLRGCIQTSIRIETGLLDG